MKTIYLSIKGTPIRISHFPGWTRINYKHLINKFSENKINQLPEGLEIITCVDDDSVVNEKSPLIKQLTENGIPFINAAEHKDVYPWINNKKIELICNALKKVKTKYCLILDGIDVVINENLDDIIDVYKTYNKKILFNATQWTHPKTEIDIIPDRKEIYGEFCYLNAGCCIGETKALKTFYGEVLEIFKNTPETDKFWHSEQYFVRKAFANNMDKVFFDYDCKIFQVWHKIELGFPKINKFNGDITYQFINTKEKEVKHKRERREHHSNKEL